MNRKLLLGLLISMYSSHIFSLPFGGFDVRSMAMGGTGVAAGDSSSASHYNPALLASAYNDDDFSFVIPFTFGPLDIATIENTVSSFSNTDYITSLTSSLTNFNNAANPTEISNTATAASTAAQNLLDGINDLADALSLTLYTKLGVLLAIPNQTLGFSAYVSSSFIASTNVDFSDADTQQIQSYINILSCLGNVDANLATGTITEQAQYLTNISTCYTVSPDLIDSSTGQFKNADLSSSLTSSVNVRGAYIKEVGLSLASTFPSLNYTSLGITPKTIDVQIFDSSVSINSASIPTTNEIKRYSDSNLDFGLIIPLSNNLKVGAVIKNIISREYKTSLNNSFILEPQLRIGAAYQNDWSAMSIDFDIIKNKKIAFEEDTQYLAIGTELDIYDTIQLRLGYRNNILSPDQVSSIGLGFLMFGANTDIALVKGNDGYEIGLQAGIKF